MRGSRNRHEKSPQTLRAELAGRLRGRALEIEKAIFRRIRGLSEPVGDDDAIYIEGLRNAVAEALEYGIECIERGGEWPAPVPSGTGRQARRAARDGVRLDTVLRRYVAGSKLLEEFVVVEAEDIPRQVLRQILRDQGPQVDRLMASAAAEFREELERTRRSSVEKLAHRVIHLLAGDGFEDAVDLDYDFDAWHVGMILMGEHADAAGRAFVERLGYRSLRVERDRETVWAWLSCAQQAVLANLDRALVATMPADTSLAMGEPRRGLDGWRLTHHEAQVALQVMLRRPQRCTRGRDVVLLAGVLRDEALARSLLENYLAPLEEHGETGQILRETLRAYFSTGGNAAAAAAFLGVTRHTVHRRIRTVEQKIGQHLHSCHAELEVALQLNELSGS